MLMGKKTKGATNKEIIPVARSTSPRSNLTLTQKKIEKPMAMARGLNALKWHEEKGIATKWPKITTRLTQIKKRKKKKAGTQNLSTKNRQRNKK